MLSRGGSKKRTGARISRGLPTSCLAQSWSDVLPLEILSSFCVENPLLCSNTLLCRPFYSLASLVPSEQGNVYFIIHLLFMSLLLIRSSSFHEPKGEIFTFILAFSFHGFF